MLILHFRREIEIVLLILVWLPRRHVFDFLFVYAHDILVWRHYNNWNANLFHRSEIVSFAQLNTNSLMLHVHLSNILDLKELPRHTRAQAIRDALIIRRHIVLQLLLLFITDEN